MYNGHPHQISTAKLERNLQTLQAQANRSADELQRELDAAIALQARYDWPGLDQEIANLQARIAELIQERK